MKPLNEELVMTQEDKELLLKDLCARTLYGVKVQYMNNIFVIDYVSSYEEVKLDTSDNWTVGVSEVKPYLFSLSSMTEEQKVELKQEHIKNEKLYVECLTMAAKGDSSMRGKVIIHYAMDWCYKNHFYIYGLIPMGLALDATGLNIY